MRKSLLLSLLLIALQAAAAENDSLLEARRLSESLRYEEAVVEYQRYLSNDNITSIEKARALLELAFIHHILQDDATARAQMFEALRLWPGLSVPHNAPMRLQEFFKSSVAQYSVRARIEILPALDKDPANLVRAQLTDAEKRVSSVELMHGFSKNGPFFSSPMRCDPNGQCRAFVPLTEGEAHTTVYYFVVARAKEGSTLSSAASYDEPLRLTMTSSERWYKSPVVWGVTGASLVLVSVVVFLAVPTGR